MCCPSALTSSSEYRGTPKADRKRANRDDIRGACDEALTAGSGDDALAAGSGDDALAAGAGDEALAAGSGDEAAAGSAADGLGSVIAYPLPLTRTGFGALSALIVEPRS